MGMALIFKASSGYSQIIKNQPIAHVPIGNAEALAPCHGLKATLRKQNDGHFPCCC